MFHGSIYTVTMPMELNPNSFCSLCYSHHNLHVHHIIPRACGGTHGPTIVVCGDCHSGIHHCATLKQSPLEYNKYPQRKQTFPEKTLLIADKLVNAIQQAETLMQKESKIDRKPIRISFVLSGKENRNLVDLAKHLGISKIDAIKYLIQRAKTS